MIDNVCATFYNEAPYKKWNGFRLLAVDGSRLMLPNHPSIKDEFGEYQLGPNADAPRSMAIASLLYDVLNLVTIDAQLAPYSSSEKALFYKHLEKVQPGDLLLMDRGYPGIVLFFILKAMGVDFCVRMKEDWWLQVKAFSETGEPEQEIELKLPQKDKVFYENFGFRLDGNITCRLVSVTLENGEKEILCTSLQDKEKYTHDEFGALYKMRWAEEEAYKLLKARAEIESFSGKTALAVKQDFFATVFNMSYCAILAFPIEEKVRKEYAKDKVKHQQKINRTSALSMCKGLYIRMFLKKQIASSIAAFDEIVYKTREIVRPNRKNERKKRPKRPYYMNYKCL